MKKATLVLVGAALVVGAAGCHREPPKKKKPAVTVVTARVRRGDVVVKATIPGTVQPERTAKLLAQVEGEVLALPHREGDRVRAGEPLVTIDPSRLKASLQEAEAQKDLVSANLEEARRVLERDRTLFQRRGLGQEALERSQTKVATLEAQLRQAEGRIAAIRAQLDDTVVRAPFDGYILERWVELGDVVAARSPLVSVASTHLVVAARVSELDLPSVSVGTEVGLAADAVRANASCPGCTGTVSRVYPKIDPSTRATTVEIRPEPECEARLKPGMFVRVTVVKARRNGVLVVPSGAIVVRPDGGKVVFVAEDTVARQRVVRTGLEGEQVTEILDGLKEGEVVIVRGQERLKDGAAIKIAGKKSGTKAKLDARGGGA